MKNTCRHRMGTRGNRGCSRLGLGLGFVRVVQPPARVAALLNLQVNGTAYVGLPPEVLSCQAPELHTTLAHSAQTWIPWQDGSTGLQHLHPQQPTTPPNGSGRSKCLRRSVDATMPMDLCGTAQGWLANRAPSQRGGCTPCQTKHCEHTSRTASSGYCCAGGWGYQFSLKAQPCQSVQCAKTRWTLSEIISCAVNATAAHKGTMPSGTPFSPFAHNTTWHW